MTKELRFLIDRELHKRNLCSFTENPDLAVMFYVGVDMEAMQLKNDPNTKCQILANIPEAALTVALIDAKTEFVVWVGARRAVEKNRRCNSPETLGLCRERDV